MNTLIKHADIETIYSDNDEGGNEFGIEGYAVRDVYTDKLIGNRRFKTKLQAWKYLTIYEENNPRKACIYYKYAKKYLKKYPELNLQG